MPEKMILEAQDATQKDSSSASSDPELQRMLDNMADGKSPSGLLYSESQLKRLAKDAERRQWQEMKRSGIKDPEKLPGESEGG